MYVFRTYPAKIDLGYDKVFLALSSMKNEEVLDANEHFKFLEFVLSVFKKKMANIFAVIGDNCSTNRSIFSSIGLKFVGFHSHCFNLCVQDVIEQSQHVVDSAQRLMKKLSYHIPAAKLRMVTPLAVVQ